MNRIFRLDLRLLVAVLPLLTACASAPPERVAPAPAPVGVPSPNAVAVLDATLWMQTAAEYQALSRQTWAVAERLLPEAVEDTAWTAAVEQEGGAGALPPAVIVDVDETMLDNSPYAARLIERDESFTEASWAEWVNEARARPISGAVEFARRARELGVELFYVTNRLSNLEEGTRRNLVAAGFPLDREEDVVLLKNEREGWGSDKATRRAWIAERYRIVLLVGDDLNDFASGARGESIETREAIVEKYGDRWGSRWIVLANPTYGSWMSAVLEGLEDPTPAEEMRRKLDALDPAEN
jgi:acid phosphatase